MGWLPGLFGANGEPWKRPRRLLMAGFDPAHKEMWLRHFP